MQMSHVVQAGPQTTDLAEQLRRENERIRQLEEARLRQLEDAKTAFESAKRDAESAKRDAEQQVSELKLMKTDWEQAALERERAFLENAKRQESMNKAEVKKELALANRRVVRKQNLSFNMLCLSK